MIAAGYWSSERHTALERELVEEVRAAGKLSEALGTLQQGPGVAAATMFEDVYRDMPRRLVDQRRQAGL